MFQHYKNARGILWHLRTAELGGPNLLVQFCLFVGVKEAKNIKKSGWSLSMDLKELWVKSSACGMRLGYVHWLPARSLPVSDELLNNVFISGQGWEEGRRC